MIDTTFGDVVLIPDVKIQGELVPMAPNEFELQELEPLEAPGWGSWVGRGVGFTVITIISYIGVTAT